MDQKRLLVKLKTLLPNITCYVCKGYIVDAVTVTECLHSFCKTCMVQHCEENNTCPKCEIVIHQSHPLHYVSTDRTLQEIVNKLVPDMKDEEICRRRTFCNEKDVSYEELFGTDSVFSLEKVQASNRSADEGDCHKSDEQIFLILSPSSDNGRQNCLGELALPAISVSTHATVTHVKKFICIGLHNVMDERFREIEILCNNEIMGKDHSLRFIQRTRWRGREAPLELAYRLCSDY